MHAAFQPVLANPRRPAEAGQVGESESGTQVG